jgi:hypothetical protein
VDELPERTSRRSAWLNDGGQPSPSVRPRPRTVPLQKASRRTLGAAPRLRRFTVRTLHPSQSFQPPAPRDGPITRTVDAAGRLPYVGEQARTHRETLRLRAKEVLAELPAFLWDNAVAGGIAAVLIISLVGALRIGPGMFDRLSARSAAPTGMPLTPTATVDNGTPTPVPGKAIIVPGPTPAPAVGSGAPPPPTETPTAYSTSAPDPHAASATITITPASQTLGSAPNMTACGMRIGSCNVVATEAAGTVTANGSAVAATGTHLQASGQLAFFLDEQDSATGPYTGSWVVSGPAGNCEGLITTSSTSPYPAFLFRVDGVRSVAVGGISGCITNGPPQTPNLLGTCWDNLGVLTDSSYQVVAPADCSAAITSAANAVNVQADATARSQLGARAIFYDAHTGGRGFACSPTAGAAGSLTTGSATVDYVVWGFLPSDAQKVALSRVNGLLQPGWYWSSVPLACASPSFASGNATVTIACAASGTATADWRAGQTSAGDAAVAALRSRLQGQPLSTALSLCKQSVGVAGCSISIANGSLLPSDVSQIMVVIG